MPSNPVQHPYPPASARGRTIDGRYRLLAPLGEGGMCTVYEAEHLYTSRRVAVKLLLPQVAGDPDVVRRFLEEARNTSRVSHPYCVDILDMGQDQDGTLYLVQELLTGMDLRRYLALHGRLTPDEALGIAIPIIEALAAAHAHGIVHRDVKPGNIFLVTAPDGTRIPKLIDFGIAKMLELDEHMLEQTRTGQALGTPSHMAPEQLRGLKPLDGRTDVWAMGVVLYQMLAGRRPFEAPNPNLLAVRILTEPVERIETHAPALPKPLAAVIHRALEPDREQRLGSMESLRSALLSCMGDADGAQPTVLIPAAQPVPMARPAPRRARATPASIDREAATRVLKPEVTPCPAQAIVPRPVEAATVVCAVDTGPIEEVAVSPVVERHGSSRRVRRLIGAGLILLLFVLGLGWWSSRNAPRATLPAAPLQATSQPAQPAPLPTPSPAVPAIPTMPPLTPPTATPQARPSRERRGHRPLALPSPPPPEAPPEPARPNIPQQGTNGAPILE